MAEKRDADLTALLASVAAGDADATARFSDAVYEQLREIAGGILSRERPDQTLRTTALVNEAYIRLAGRDADGWEGRSHYLGTAAKAMRSILVDYARARNAQKRGGKWKRAPLDNVVDAIEIDQVDLVGLDDALQRLETMSDRKARVIELRFFAGLTIAETAKALGVSTGTVENDWEFSRAWLHRELGGDES